MREPEPIVIADPATELLALVRRVGESPSAGERTAAALLRRRFALALPPPFADPVDLRDVAAAPVRLSVATDGPAIAAVKWRAFGTCYRGVLPDEFIDQREIVPPVGFWIGRATLPPSRRHLLTVLGRPGQVLGYCSTGPCRDADLDPSDCGEIYEIYLDPSHLRSGGGGRLLADAVDRMSEVGLTDLRLWVLEANRAARAFYESCGWSPDDAARQEEFAGVSFTELRYRYRRSPSGR